MVATFESPSAVPMLRPRTSPMAQPVRQWSVAEIETPLSARPEVERPRPGPLSLPHGSRFLGGREGQGDDRQHHDDAEHHGLDEFVVETAYPLDVTARLL